MVKRIVQLEASQVKDAIEEYFKLHMLPSLPAWTSISFINVVLAKIVEVGLDVPVEKAADVPNKVIEQPVNEPSFRIDDTIIIRPINKTGEEIVRQFGNCWVVKNASKDNWYAINYRTVGRMSGDVGGKSAYTSIAIPKDRRSPNNCYEVISVNKFPDEFKPREMWSAMKLTLNKTDDELKEYLTCTGV